MSKACYITPGDKVGDIWFVYEPSGLPIGACSSREGALQIAGIANRGKLAVHSQLAPRLQAAPRPQPDVQLAPVACVGKTASKSQATMKPIATARTDGGPESVAKRAAAQWNAPQHRGVFWSLYNRWERLLGG